MSRIFELVSLVLISFVLQENHVPFVFDVRYISPIPKLFHQLSIQELSHSDCKIDDACNSISHQGFLHLNRWRPNFCPLVIRVSPYRYTLGCVAPVANSPRIFFIFSLVFVSRKPIAKPPWVFHQKLFWHPRPEVDEYRRVCLERCAVGMPMESRREEWRSISGFSVKWCKCIWGSRIL